MPSESSKPEVPDAGPPPPVPARDYSLRVDFSWTKAVDFFNSFEKKFSQDLIWSMGSLAILAASGIVINIIIARFAGANALGIFNQVFAIYIVATQLGVGGLQYSVLKHVSHAADDPLECAAIVTSALALVTACSLLIALILFFGRHLLLPYFQSPSVIEGIGYILIGLIFFALNKVLLLGLSALRQIKAFSAFQGLRYFLIFAFIGILIAFDAPDAMLALALTAAELVLFLALLFITVRSLPLWKSFGTRKHYRDHISFGLRGSLSGILLELNTRVDIIMLGIFSADSVVGVYSFAAILAEGFRQIPGVVRWNLDPIFGRNFAAKDTAAISALARKVKIAMFCGMTLLALIAVSAYPFALPLLVGDDSFSASWVIFSILMVGVVLNAGFSPAIGLFLQGGRPGSYSLIILFLTLSNIVLNALLIPSLGMNGAAAATAFTFVIEAVVIVVLARKFFEIKI